ncbi:MAG TPA: TonB-dependent receptor [Longimicrobiales bacterium]
MNAERRVTPLRRALSRPRPAGRAAALALALAPTVAPAPALAQETPDTVRLDELVVTATRVAVPLATVPAAVSVVQGAALRARGVAHVLDAIRALPGIAVVQSGSHGATTSLFLRGGESDYVQVLVDGVPLNEPGGRADLANLSTDNIERIEVVRGPASVLYGSDAVGGVIQVFTREGRGRPRANATVRAGSRGTLDYGADVSGAAGALGYAFSASRFETDGIYAFNNEYRNDALSGRLRFAPDARTEASLTVRYGEGEFHYPTDGAGNIVDRNAFQTEERLVVGLEAARRLTDRLETRLLLAFSGIDADIRDAQDGPADTLGFYASSARNDTRRRSLDLRANYDLAGTALLTAGVELEDQSLESRSAYESEFGPGTDAFDAERSNRGVYAQALLRPTPALALTLGARLDDNEAFGTFDTYRAGVAYHPAAGTKLRASVGTAFKEPTFYENFAVGFVRGNPELRPERSLSWEVGVEQTLLGDRLSLAATVFDQRFRDLIQYRSLPFGSTEPNYQNVVEADAAGAELELRVSPADALSAGVAYTFLDTEAVDAGYATGPDAEFVEGRPLIRRPAHAARFDFRYAPRERGSLDLAVRFVGERDDLDFSGGTTRRVTLPAYTVADLGVQWTLLRRDGRRPGLTALLRVENLFDHSYEEIANFPARGRTILAGLRIGAGL